MIKKDNADYLALRGMGEEEEWKRESARTCSINMYYFNSQFFGKVISSSFYRVKNEGAKELHRKG